MRVLHTISSPAAGGAEVYVKDLAKNLVERQTEVHIAFLNNAATVERSSDYENKFLQDLRESGISYFFLGGDVRRFPWRGAFRIRDYVRDHKIDIYHAHLTYGVLFGAFLKIPRVYTHHNIKMRVSRKVFTFLMRFIDQLIGISQVCANELAKYSGRDVITIDNGVDDNKIITVDITHYCKLSELHCIAVGRICQQKNYELLVRAVALLPAKVRENVAVTIIGEGAADETERLKKRIIEERLDRVIVLAGGRDDVPSQLAKSHVFLMTSKYEGLPIALIEAARTGLPCIVTDVGGCREVIENCKNGIVAQPENAEEIASAIERFIREPSLLSICSENAKRFSSMYSIDRAASSHLNVYERLIQSRN